jgi:anaerobic ribonucleoside-triphosphate reductase activating protein
VKIISIEYSLAYFSLDIYVAGCKCPHCPGCHNPESWGFLQGKDYTEDFFDSKIKKKILDNNTLIKRVMVFGGEPLDQDLKDLERMLKDIKSIGMELWLFTGHSFDTVPDFVKKYCDVIKCGKYIEKLKTDNGDTYCGVKLATSNQKFNLKGKQY